MGGRLRFTVGGDAYDVALLDNALAHRITAMCPFELDYVPGGDHEYYAALPERMSAAGCEATTQGQKNGLYFFERWNAISIVIKDCNTAPYPIHPVGRFEADIASALQGAGRHVRIRCAAE